MVEEGRGLSIGQIGRDAAGCLGHRAGDQADACGQRSRHGVGYVAGNVLGGGIEGVEGRDFIQIAVVEGREGLAEGALDFVEVADEAVLIKFRCFDAERDVPVVPVQGLALASDHDGVCGAE